MRSPEMVPSQYCCPTGKTIVALLKAGTAAVSTMTSCWKVRVSMATAMLPRGQVEFRQIVQPARYHIPVRRWPFLR
jgi:hypothetical protein